MSLETENVCKVYRVVRDLRFIVPANDSNSCYGVFKKGNKYYLTNIDGGGNNFALVINNEKHWVHPNGLRNMILHYLKLNIPLTSRIYIHPCNSYLIRKHYKKELVENNIYLIKPNGKDGAYYLFSDKEKVYTKPNEKKNAVGEFFDIAFVKCLGLPMSRYAEMFNLQ